MAKPDKKQMETVNETENQPVLTDAQLKNQKRQEKLQQKKQAKAKENAKKEKKKAKSGDQKPKTNKGKEVVGELKKVTWPSFPQVVKNTLLVIGIVLLITAGLFLVDIVYSWIHQLLVDGGISAWLPWQNM